MGDYEERIVMTPTKKEKNHTILRMERMRKSDLEANNDLVHVAGGDHQGIIINKRIASNGDLSCSPPQLCLSFKVFLINATTQMHTQESRQLKFWFKEDVGELKQMHTAQDFFRDLVNPSNFPRDYVGFIMKIMKLMQQRYSTIKQMEVEMKQLEETSQPPSRPMSVDESQLSAKVELNEQKVLEIIESAYPNPISLAEIANSTQSAEEEVHFFIQELESKNLIKNLQNEMYTRITQDDNEVKLVRQMPKVVRSEQPTIAIITAQYCEKLAVDAMIDNKTTYMRFKTEGESNVYTLGNIGIHRVVSTKLPAIGHSRGAMIAAGNTTTRLLGIFQRVEYVFLVGVGGGVPHYTDFNRHVRLGDVVVASPPQDQSNQYIYMHCEKIKNSPEERAGSPDGCKNSIESFNYRFWCPPNLELQEIAKELWMKGLKDSKSRSWEENVREGIDLLQQQESEFQRPPPNTDKLYMSIGTKDVIEMGHPDPPPDAFDPRADGMPIIHFGAVGSGRMAVKDEQIRQDIASKFGILAFDAEFESVAESVYGNRKDKYVLIRGISDYKDGTRRKEWQPHAALCAAAVMKSIILDIQPGEEEL